MLSSSSCVFFFALHSSFFMKGFKFISRPLSDYYASGFEMALFFTLLVSAFTFCLAAVFTDRLILWRRRVALINASFYPFLCQKCFHSEELTVPFAAVGDIPNRLRRFVVGSRLPFAFRAYASANFSRKRTRGETERRKVRLLWSTRRIRDGGDRELTQLEKTEGDCKYHQRVGVLVTFHVPVI